jgi:hypothetical protein
VTDASADDEDIFVREHFVVCTDVQLGRNLAAAFIPTCHGVGLDYARKKYAGQPVGQYIGSLSRKVAVDLSTRC